MSFKNLYILFVIILLSGKCSEVNSFITKYPDDEFNENQEEDEDKNYEKLAPAHSSPSHLSPAPPAQKINSVGSDLVNPKSYLNLKKMSSSHSTSSNVDSNMETDMKRNGSVSPTSNARKCVNETGDNDKGLLREYKMYSYEEINNNTNDNHRPNQYEKFNSGNSDIIKDSIDGNDISYHINKIFNESNLERMLLPTLNALVTKLFSNMANQDESFKNQKMKNVVCSDKRLDNTKVGIVDGNNNIDKLEQYLSGQLLKSLVAKKNSSKSSHKSSSIEGLIDRLVLEKAFVESMALKHNNSENGRFNSFTEDNPNRWGCDCNEKKSYLNEINHYHKLQEVLDNVLKEIILKDIQTNNEDSDDNLVKHLHKLVASNSRSLREHEKCKKPDNIGSAVSDQMTIAPQTDKDGDKYYSHNIVQMSDDRQDKEYPLGVLEQIKNALHSH